MAELEAKITLDARQYERIARDVQAQARQVQAQMGQMAQSVRGVDDALQQAALAQGLFYDSMGRLRHLNGQFASEAERAAAGLENIGVQATAAARGAQRAQSAVVRAAQKMRAELQRAAQTLGAVSRGLGAVGSAAAKGFAAASAVAGGFFAYVAKEAGDAKEIMQTAFRLNMDTTSFQTFEYAVTKFGVSADKAGDILKDVNDKIGDFITTGGGEAKDVFEALKLEAEAFIGLSPEEALIKIGDAMKGLSTQDKTFLFESLADDASLLIPLLDDGAAKLRELKKEAVGRGAVLSPEELKALGEFKDTLGGITSRVVAFGQHVAGFMARPLQVLLDEANKIIDSFGGMDAAALKFSETLVGGLEAMGHGAAGVYGWFVKWEIALLKVKGAMLSLLARFSDEAEQELFGLAEELGNAELKVSLAEAEAEKFAATIGKKMRDTLKESAKDLAKNQKNGYAAQRPNEDVQRSLDAFKKRKAEEEEKEKQKEVDKEAREIERAAKEQIRAAEKLEAAATKLDKSADGKTDLDRRWEERQKLIQRQREIDAVYEARRAKVLKDWHESGGKRELPEREAQPSVREQQRGMEALYKAAEAMSGQGGTAAEIKRMAEQMRQEQGQQNQAQTQIMAEMQKAADSVNELIRKQQEHQQSQAQDAKQASEAITQNMNVNFSGGVSVRLEGVADAVGKAVVQSRSFQDGLGEILKKQFGNYLRHVARAV